MNKPAHKDTHKEEKKEVKHKKEVNPFGGEHHRNSDDVIQDKKWDE